MKFKFPDVGEGITEGVIVKWKIKVGDKVKADQPIADVETDKAIVEIPVPKAGIIAKIFHKQGETINVGEVLVEIDTGEISETKVSDDALKSKQVSDKVKETPKVKEIKQASGKRYTSSVVGFLDDKEETIPSQTKRIEKSTEKRIRATPRIRRLAKKLGVDLSTIKGTGHGGRIIEEDLSGIKTKSKKPIGKIQVIPLKGIRKTISQTLTKANTIEVPVTNFYDCDVTSLWDVRNKEKVKAQKKGVKLTFLPYIIKAVLESMKEYPIINSSIENDEIIIKNYFNIGIAVATTDGLIVPNIKDADKKSLYDLAKQIVDLAKKAQNRTLKLEEMKDGTFTITNLGSIGVKYFTPMLNYPEAAILGLGKIEERAIVENGKIVIKKILPLSITYDHRSVDGATASKFMLSVMKSLESY
ncbi:2-oxo acid dehydrogenase subunit E2 [archaeon]|jgi:pyruvate dehydrogenase E2 component (dihydrolipoamide acetyltransferase)|nr:2-oxo acid dehydrogenase subunit E2 [archaeon]MBT4021786.1 2-oxo acid dehydrogenase subunit E2 [archaeon]MBT4271799.1 2-oxo acid dehydrogenase subunit E2 [archaeon]MBT4460506.1 2-oxo acid dehydrogenase subunit E2 [archaeon]MBT4858526.1 2-oxo acid dehydrogenase subunit E2 [archaeon]